MRCFIYFFIRKLKEKNYCINCGVLDGFLALIKTVTVRVQCYNNFFLKNKFDIINQLFQV